PNCMGLVDPVNKRYFSFMNPWAVSGLMPGPVSLIVQSGMLSAAFLLDIMSNGLTGISKACSIGNKVDVDECDLLEVLLGDDCTQSIALYLESFSDGRRFADLCRRSPKPIVVLKGGKSRKGAEAAMSHTASLAGNHRIARQVLAQAGVVEAEDFKEMIDLARTLAMVAPRNGARVAILTFSGGAGIVSADAFEGKPLTVAELSESTKDILKSYFPPWMPVSNPVDLWPAMEVHGRSKMYSASVKAALQDPGVDAILMHAAAWDKSAMDLKEIAEAAKGAGKPVFIWYIGQRDTIAHYQAEALELKIPAFLELSRAIECMASAFGKEALPMQESGSSESAGTVLEPDLRRLIETGDGPLDEYQSKRVLAACGIPVVDEQIVQAVQDLEPAASRMGYPVVLKGLLPGEVHKTERGLVRLNVANRAEAAQAHREMTLKMGGKGVVLLQKQVSGRVELICGLLRDSQFGPCVMLGVGGIMAEVIDDAVFAMAPLSRGEALGLIGRLRSQRLLDGFRGGPPVNRAELAGILVALGELGLSQPRVREVDINPLILAAEGLVSVDANIVLGS
ncbi:MAG TPA: acetate--CoA ligase family protein, partial [Syntrophales bacterium]|nr:acetate--CoA ligase family protein [Syntrophales bacterium]